MRVRFGVFVVGVAALGLALFSPSVSASPAGRTYSTTYGDMTWTGSGSATYTTDSGVITGSLNGLVFTGRWGEASSARNCGSTGPSGTPYWGGVVFTFNADFTAFTGSWDYCGGSRQGSWNGTMKNPPRPTPTPTPTPPPKCQGKAATIVGSGLIVGTKGPDVIVGSEGADTINGRGGRDTICGLGGDDTIRGGAGRDNVSGGGGDDNISGGPGHDNLDGGAHRDVIRGDKGDDAADGGAGRDQCAAERERSCEEDPPIPGPLVEWKMLPRYGQPDDQGIIRPTARVKPSFYEAEFRLRRGNGKPCRSTDGIETSGARFSTPDPSKPCLLIGRFDTEREFQVTFTLTTDEGEGLTIEDVLIQDWLIVGIGDSNGSGEGTPDVPGAFSRSAVWVNRQCHRSGNSHQALTARRIENADDKTSVTFRHLACSGAQIEQGLLKGYRGIVPGARLRPQLDVLARMQEIREVDAVFVSAGVNDLHFGEMVTFCVIWERCPERTWETFGSETLDTVMKRNLSRLPALYQQLNDRLDAAGIPSDRVYITEYFDSTTDAAGNRCDPLIRFAGGLRDFDKSEADWAANSVLKPLNAHVRNAAARHGWNLVSGAERGFVGHGICAGKSSWIITRAQSRTRQGDQNGTLHATIRGNRQQRALMYPVVVEDLYREGTARRPA